MQQTNNQLLKVGSILFIIGGLLGGLVPIISSLSSMGSADQIKALYGSEEAFDQMILAQTGGTIDGDTILGIFYGMIIAIAAIYAVMMIIHVLVGILGLSRSKDPQRVRFFKVWGVVLLVFGVLNVLLSGVFSLNAILGLISGVAAPILFLVGASQVKKGQQA